MVHGNHFQQGQTRSEYIYITGSRLVTVLAKVPQNAISIFRLWTRGPWQLSRLIGLYFGVYSTQHMAVPQRHVSLQQCLVGQALMCRRAQERNARCFKR